MSMELLPTKTNLRLALPPILTAYIKLINYLKWNPDNVLVILYYLGSSKNSRTPTYLIIHFSGDLTPEDVLDHLRKIIKLGEEKFGVKARLILCNVVGFGDYALRSLFKFNQYRRYCIGKNLSLLTKLDLTNNLPPSRVH